MSVSTCTEACVKVVFAAHVIIYSCYIDQDGGASTTRGSAPTQIYLQLKSLYLYSTVCRTTGL